MAQRGQTVVVQLALVLALLSCKLSQCQAAKIPRDIAHWQYQGAPAPNASAVHWHLRPRFWLRHHLDAATVHQSFGQWRNLFVKLDRGERIKVAAFGSSVTKDYSGYFGSPEHLQAAGYMKGGMWDAGPAVDGIAMADPAVKEQHAQGRASGWLPGWMNYVMQVINATWPQPPGASGHLYANLGFSGMRVDRFGQDHLSKYVPPDIDLMVLDNMDAQAEGPTLETLLIAIEKHRNGTLPAILILSTSNLFAAGQGCWGGEPYCGPAHCSEPKFFVLDGRYILSRREDVVFQVSQWYGLSALSWPRLALSMERDENLFNLTQCQFLASIMSDQIHPSELGMVLIADAIVNQLVHAQGHLLNHPTHKPPGRPATRLYNNPRVRNPEDVVQQHTVTFFSATDKNADSQLRVQNTTTGWNFTLYQLHGNATKYKPGWVALKVGARLVVRMPEVLHLWRTHLHMATLRVSYLSSYTFMGSVLVRCISPSACACDPTIISGAIDGAGDWKGRHTVSVTDEKSVRLYLPRQWAWDGPANKKMVAKGGSTIIGMPPPAPAPAAGLVASDGPLPGETECDVEFTVMESRLAGSGSDIHKFKITRMVLDWETKI